MRPAIFLDRDGVIIENRLDHVKSWGDVSLIPVACAALKRLRDSGYTLVLVSNQSVAGRGIITLDEVNRIHDRLVEKIVAEGGWVDASYLCPHAPEDRCTCRKPAPGLLLRAAEEMQLDIARSFMVGDAATDMQAARAAGVRGVFVMTGRGPQQLEKLKQEVGVTCTIVDDLAAAADHILAQREITT